MQEPKECDACSGRGEVPPGVPYYPWQTCEKCGGSGKTPVQKQEVKTPEFRVSAQVQEWRKDSLHLPPFMRDFHDQKDVFKTIDLLYSRDKDRPVDWVSAQVYVIDRFLWFMAAHGYTLQKTHKKLDFNQLQDTLKIKEEHEFRTLELMFNAVKTEQKPE